METNYTTYFELDDCELYFWTWNLNVKIVLALVTLILVNDLIWNVFVPKEILWTINIIVHYFFQWSINNGMTYPNNVYGI